LLERISGKLARGGGKKHWIGERPKKRVTVASKAPWELTD